MKKLFLFFFIVSTSLFAQTSKKNELTADGHAKAMVKPDIAIVTMRIVKHNETEKTALKDLNEQVEKLQKSFTKIGIPDKSIKLSDFRISSDNDYNEESKKEYRAVNTLIIEFKLDNKVLDAIYTELQTGNYKDIDVDFDTEISDELEKNTRRKLVQDAIQDTKLNAENIAKTLGVKIVNISDVSKFGNEMVLRRVANQVRYDAIAAAAPAPIPTAFSKFEVEEKELEESITIVFEIVNTNVNPTDLFKRN
jgi:uncharacterized protein YggE